MEEYNFTGDLDTAESVNECAKSAARAIRRAGHSLPRARRCVACAELTDSWTWLPTGSVNHVHESVSSAQATHRRARGKE
jgi:hypothetical protein